MIADSFQKGIVHLDKCAKFKEEYFEVFLDPTALGRQFFSLTLYAESFLAGPYVLTIFKIW